MTSAAEVAERGRLLGLPVAVLGETAPAPPVVSSLGPGRTGSMAGVLVADLSSMWAGPLCGQLLARAGAAVVKVESRSRADGTRAGAPEFFDWMNGGKLSYAVDFDDPRDLAALMQVSDVVIEASRPAAPSRRGLGPDTVAARPGRIWLRITGHGTAGRRPAGWLSATMPRCQAASSDTARAHRYSAATPSRTRSPDSMPRLPWRHRGYAVAES